MNRKHVVLAGNSFDQINHLKREIIRLCGVAWMCWHSATVALYCRASLLESATYSLVKVCAGLVDVCVRLYGVKSGVGHASLQLMGQNICGLGKLCPKLCMS